MRRLYRMAMAVLDDDYTFGLFVAGVMILEGVTLLILGQLP